MKDAKDGMTKILYGAGCQGRVCMDIADCNGWKFDWVVDDHAKSEQVHGVPVIEREHFPKKIRGIFKFVVAVGDNALRQQFSTQMVQLGGTPINLVHPFSQFSCRASIGIGLVSMPGVVMNTDISIGDYCVLNTSCSIDHDCILEDFVNISPGVHLAGNVHVGEGTFLGTGCIVNPNIKIGTNCVVGSGAVVTTDIPDFSVAYGVPARIQKTK